MPLLDQVTMTDNASVNNSQNKPAVTLSTSLGKGAAMAMVVGAVIGSGIFAKPAANAMASNSVPLILVGWIMGGFITLMGGICMAELALMMPLSGGPYVYIRQAYGRIPAFLSGWNESVFFQSSANSALAVFFTMTLSKLIGQEFSTTQTVVIVLSMITLLTVINCLGVVWGGMVQSITTVIKVLILISIAILPFTLLFADNESFTLYKFIATPQLSSAPESMIGMFTLVMMSVMWAYSGGWMVTGIAEEIKNPEKNLSFALIGGAIVLMVIYVSVNIAFHGILSLDEMIVIAGDPAKDIPQEAVKAYLLPISTRFADLGGMLLSSIILVSAFSALNTGLLTPPRVLFAMARDAMFIPSFARIHPRFRTPHVAIIGQGLASSGVFLMITALVVLVGLGTNGKTDARNVNTADEIFNYLTNIAVFSSTVFVTMTVGAVFVLRYREPDRARPYRVPGYPFIPAMALLINTAFLILVALDDLWLSVLSIGFLVLSLPLYFLFSKQMQPPDA
ncbi:MAG: amino acid permease [Planctomycetes bacterium]|nr:amino acid permease [Planctomycetota bacterium]